MSKIAHRLIGISRAQQSTTNNTLYTQAVLADNPSLYIPLNETSGNVVHEIGGDPVGAYLNGVVLGADRLLSTKIDKYAYLPANNSYSNGTPVNPPIINLNQSINFDFSHDFSLECWIKPFSYSQPGAIAFTGASIFKTNDFEIGISRIGGQNYFTFHTLTFGYFRYLGAPALNSITHLVLAYSIANAGTFTLYFNGVPVAQYINSNLYVLGTQSSITIGAQGYVVGEFNGLIGEVAIYNQNLNPAKVATHYNAGSGQGISAGQIPAPSYFENSA